LLAKLSASSWELAESIVTNPNFTQRHTTGIWRSVLALGYSGWGAGQLEAELADNAWLVSDMDPDLIFSSAHESKWRHALGRLGIESGRLQVDPGNA